MERGAGGARQAGSRGGPALRARAAGRLALIVSLALGLAGPAGAQINRHPNGVNVDASGATTVFITYGNLQGKVPVEAAWCGEIVPAAPDIGFRCDPSTLFGILPIRYDRSRVSGVDGFTDIMSIPPSVARRAFQAAEAGAESAFFYVRRFVDPEGLRPDEYVPVTCRMAGGGARVPFALLDVRLGFAVEEPVVSLASGSPAPPVQARLTYNGTGRLRGRWEVVFPGDEPPTSEDLLTEATLPAELRGTQRRFTELGRFNVFLPPTGEFVLEGPDPARIPTHMDGLYLVLLRIEAADDKEGDSDLGEAGAGAGVVHSGAVAGFPIPPLRYYVGSAASLGAPAAGLALLLPREGASVDRGKPLVFSWSPSPSAVVYRLEVESTAGERVLAAYVQPGVEAYAAPPWLADRLADGGFYWRVASVGPGGRTLGETPWREGRFTR